MTGNGYTTVNMAKAIDCPLSVVKLYVNYIVIKLRNKEEKKDGREGEREKQKKNPSSFVERPALLVCPGLSQFYH